MPSIEENVELWGDDYDWSHSGDRWSAKWGGVDMHWYGTLLPRIHEFLPAKTILEIAPGYGRWTQYLKDQCERLIAVDLSAVCIEACRQRFNKIPHISLHLNDGKSLNMVPDNSVDFVFSFDSLVHAESAVLEAYLSQLVNKLTPEGVGFVHHSNLGEFEGYFSKTNKLPPNIRYRIHQWGLLERDHWRAMSMTAERFVDLAERYGLQAIGQEIINWSSKREIDCISTFCKKGSTWERPNIVVRNPNFTAEIEQWGRISRLYGAKALVRDQYHRQNV
ncbi:MAG: class I SAM-dependent methyltransferase [Proteobacteria bacterium]|nr:class I SAM-dependent methyltransferase [Pseudomonadota bacterium]